MITGTGKRKTTKRCHTNEHALIIADVQSQTKSYCDIHKLIGKESVYECVCSVLFIHSFDFLKLVWVFAAMLSLPTSSWYERRNVFLGLHFNYHSHGGHHPFWNSNYFYRFSIFAIFVIQSFDLMKVEILLLWFRD